MKFDYTWLETQRMKYGLTIKKEEVEARETSEQVKTSENDRKPSTGKPPIPTASRARCLPSKMAGRIFLDVFIARNCITLLPVKRFKILFNARKFWWKNEEVWSVWLYVISRVRAKMRRFAAIVNNVAIISQFAWRFHFVTAAKRRATNLKGILTTPLQRTLLETKEQLFFRQRSRVLPLMRTTGNRRTCVYCLTMEASEVT